MGNRSQPSSSLSPIKTEPEENTHNEPNASEQPDPKMIRHDFRLDQLGQGFDRFRQKQLLTDFLVVSGDEEFHVHKLLMAIYSAQIEGIVYSGESVLDLSDVNPEIVSSLLAFIYQGQVEVRADQLEELLALGARLEIAGLSATGLVRKKTPNKRKISSSEAGSPSKRLKPDDIERFEKKDEEYVKAGDSFICNYCLHTFGSLPTILRHVQLHTGTSPKFSCFRCNNFESRHKHHLKNHFIKAHGVEGKAFDVIWKKRQAENTQAQEDEDNPTHGHSTSTPGSSNATPGSSNATPGPSTSTPIPKTNKKTGNGRKSSFAKRVKSEPMDEDDPLGNPER